MEHDSDRARHRNSSPVVVAQVIRSSANYFMAWSSKIPLCGDGFHEFL
ncbi:hypothetical protein LINPERHAP1_LOCUS20355 [Linum perenne]